MDRRSKIEALTRLIDVNDFRYGIIFCSTKIMVDDLDEHLHARGYMTDRLHGDISQAQRDRVMDKFRRRGFEFLVATDVAARGLDVDDLEVVFNFDLPNDAEDYTHRIGRTGRAGRKGQAFTFVSGQEIYKLQSMVRWAKLDIRRGKIPSMDEVDEARKSLELRAHNQAAYIEQLESALAAAQADGAGREAERVTAVAHATSTIRLDWAWARHRLICAGAGPTRPHSLQGLGSPLPKLHRRWLRSSSKRPPTSNSSCNAPMRAPKTRTSSSRRLARRPRRPPRRRRRSRSCATSCAR